MANRKENQPVKEKKGFTRRQFLKGALALGASALVGSGCQPETPSSQPEKSPTDQPSKTPTKEVSPTSLPTATEEPTGIPTPEATPTPEAKLLEGIDIDREYLQNAFTGIGGGETIDNGGKEVSFVQFGQDYVRRSWGEEIDFASLPEDSVASLKYLVSLASYQGRLGFFCPGKEGETIAFPGLVKDKEGQEKPLTLLRLELENLPSKDPSGEDYSEWTFPQGLELLRDTQMTVLGYLEQDREGKLVIDQGKEGSELVYALTAFTDYNRADEDSGAPRHYLALLPTHFPADPDNKQALTLANLLEGNGYDYDPAQRAVSFIDPATDQKTIWQLNKLVGQDLSSDLYRAAGLTFVDQLDGEQINNPILPYPQGVQDRYQLEREDNQFIFTGQNEEGEEITLKATYQADQEAWRWEEMGVVNMVGVVEKDGEEFQVVEIDGRQEEVLKIEGLSLRWNEEEERFEYFDVDEKRVAYWIGPEEGQRQGRLEITPPTNREGLRYLDFEKHLGLFKPLSAQESNEIFYQQWNKDQEIRIPFPLDIRQGGVVEEKKVVNYLLCFKNLENDTIVFSPMAINVSKGTYGKDRAWNATFKIDGNGLVDFTFPPQGEFLASGYVGAGDPIIRLAGDYYPEYFSLGLYKDYQFDISDVRKGRGIDFGNLVKDYLGRVTYLSGR